MRVLPNSFLLGLLDNSFDFQLFLDISRSKRRIIVGHLIGVHSYGPNIDLFLVSLLEYHLRCVVNCGTSFSTAQLVFLNFFGQSEISQFRVTVLENEHVLWFQVTVHDIFGMKVLHTEDKTT